MRNTFVPRLALLATASALVVAACSSESPVGTVGEAPVGSPNFALVSPTSGILSVCIDPSSPATAVYTISAAYTAGQVAPDGPLVGDVLTSSVSPTPNNCVTVLTKGTAGAPTSGGLWPKALVTLNASASLAGTWSYACTHQNKPDLCPVAGGLVPQAVGGASNPHGSVVTFKLTPPIQALFTLTTSTAGTGTGTISPAPPTSSYLEGTTVPVTAVADAGSTFTGFSGACTGTGACSVLMDEDKAVVANFALIPPTMYTLTTSTAGTGTGTISPPPPTSSYSAGTTVPVTAVAAAGSTFTGFSGACTGTGACSVLMDADKAVVANFALIGTPLFVIGDVEPHGIGTTVNFWGAQWWKNNFMSGIVDHGVASFKGYATEANNFCGGTWISRVGNSPPPPATISGRITIIVTSTVRKIGPDIGGTIVQILTIDQDGGYGPNPGHAGNGIVRIVNCSTP